MGRPKSKNILFGWKTFKGVIQSKAAKLLFKIGNRLMVMSSLSDNVIVLKLCKLWRGEYSLAKAFWGFFIFGSGAVAFAAVLVIHLFEIDASEGRSLLLFIYCSYIFVAAVGVWRSGTNYADYFAKKGSPYLGKPFSGLAKFFVCIIVIGNICRVVGISAHDVLSLIAKAFKH